MSEGKDSSFYHSDQGHTWCLLFPGCVGRACLHKHPTVLCSHRHPEQPQNTGFQPNLASQMDELPFLFTQPKSKRPSLEAAAGGRHSSLALCRSSGQVWGGIPIISALGEEKGTGSPVLVTRFEASPGGRRHHHRHHHHHHQQQQKFLL